MDLATGLETIRPWIGTGGILGCLAFAARVWQTNRKLTMQDRAEQHKQELEEGDFEREGYGKLMAVMRDQINSLMEDAEHQRTQIGDLRGQLAECRLEHASSRAEVAHLKAEVQGLHRQLILHSSTTAIQLGEATSPSVGAARRVLGIVSDAEDETDD